MSRIAAVARNTFRESVRERVLYNLVFFAFLMMVSGLLMRDLSIRQEGKIIKDVGLAAIEVFGLMMAIFLGVGLLTKEIERRSLYPLLARPLSRDEFLLGKFLGLCFTLTVNTGVMTLGMFATAWLSGGHPDVGLLKAVYAILLSLYIVVALAQLLSALSSPLVAVVGTLGLLLAGRLSDVVKNARDVLPDAPGWLIRAVYLALPNFRDFDLKTAAVYGDPIPAGQLAWLTAYAVVYAAIALLLAAAAFRRRELV